MVNYKKEKMEPFQVCKFLIMFLICSDHLIISKAGTFKPEPKFQCENFYQKGELYVDCSNRNMTDIPNLPSNTAYLNLQHNLIGEIPDNTFENMYNLKVLDLSFNKIGSINQQVFYGLCDLRHLKLKNNYLNNSLSKRRANNSFEHLTNLTLLDLSYNNLQSINIQTFTGLANLKHLKLDHNELLYKLERFPKGSFKPLKSLTDISIQNNNDLTKPTFALFAFPDETISDLKKLEVLKLDVNIPLFETKVLCRGYLSLHHLTSLNFSNCLHLPLHDNVFRYTPNLRYLYINHCHQMLVTSEALSGLTKLEAFWLDLDCQSGYKFGQEQIIKLFHSLAKTPVKVVKMNNVFFTSQMFSWNKIFDLLSTTSVHELTFTNNKILQFSTQTFRLPAPPDLQILDLSGNMLKQIALNLTYVLILKLNSNALGGYLSEHQYMTTQDSKLEYVNLSNNSIHQLNFTMFHGQQYLQIIDLNSNFLKAVHFDLSYLTKLKVMNLANNAINFLDVASMRNIDKVLENDNTKIDFINNPLQCTCYTVPFLKWMKANRQHFINVNQYKCTYENGSTSTLNSFEKVIKHLQEECISYAYLIISASFAIFGFIIVLFGAFIYRHRWKLRYIFYTAKLKYTSIKNTEDNLNEYTYDAFISYSDEDRTFVTQDCIQNLEHDYNLRLCIHQRDFLPGQDITDNIINAIQNSRKTICIITRSFLDSYYCMFEYNMARMENVHSRKGKNVLFLVFYEKLLPEELPLLLYELIQKQSYIEYPNDEHGNVIFWEKIKDAIQT
ncbi:toll-like receptor 4 [Mytilus californianus]|uniref:toll-like receptor 4 n=1 Tax=Mytilus californianus TaxID=6549 RepID=UPI002245F6D6|nr:toll-like receptor 4 [Mytilus californianus]